MHSLITFLTLFFFNNANSQSHASLGSLQNDTTYTLVGDTLFSNKTFKIFIGQPLLIGKASGERDWYNTITFKSGASWPLVLNKKSETELNLEYQLNPSIREKDKVKEILTPGDTLFVRKIKRFGSKRSRYRYQVTMGQKQGFLSLNFKCDLLSAIKLREVVLIEI